MKGTKKLGENKDWQAFDSTLQISHLFGEFIFLSRVEGRGFHVEGEGAMSRVEGNIFFFQNLFFGKSNNRCNQCH